MSMIRVGARWCLVLSALSGPMVSARAQDPWRVTVKKDAAGTTLTSNELKESAPTTLASSSVLVAVTCDSAGPDCGNVKVQTVIPGASRKDAVTQGLATRRTRTFRIDRSSFRTAVGQPLRNGHLIFFVDGDSARSYAITLLPDAPQDRARESGLVLRDTVQLNELLTSPACLAAEPEGTGSEFIVSATGTVASRPARTLNESQRAIVAVYADERLAPLLQIERRSPFRPVRLNNIISGNVSIPLLPGITEAGRQAASEEEQREPRCVVRYFEVADFAPGRAVVELSALTSAGREVTGSFDFTVNELYTGAFTLGGVRSTAHDPRFGTTTVRRDTTIGTTPTIVTDTVVTITEDRGDRLLYVLSYTPFIWGERDPKEPPARWMERVNPMVGIALNDVANNAFIGLSIDLSNRIYGLYGVHAARITELDPNSGMAVGGRVGSAPVSTTRRWTFRSFYGVSVDLQAGLDLLRKVLSPAGGAGGE